MGVATVSEPNIEKDYVAIQMPCVILYWCEYSPPFVLKWGVGLYTGAGCDTIFPKLNIAHNSVLGSICFCFCLFCSVYSQHKVHYSLAINQLTFKNLSEEIILIVFKLLYMSCWWHFLCSCRYWQIHSFLYSSMWKFWGELILASRPCRASRVQICQKTCPH